MRVYKNKIELTSTFSVKTNKPIDDRILVETTDDLDEFINKGEIYDGFETIVINDFKNNALYNKYTYGSYIDNNNLKAYKFISNPVQISNIDKNGDLDINIIANKSTFKGDVIIEKDLLIGDKPIDTYITDKASETGGTISYETYEAIDIVNLSNGAIFTVKHDSDNGKAGLYVKYGDKIHRMFSMDDEGTIDLNEYNE